EHETLLEHLAFSGNENRQGGRAAGQVQQPLRPRLRDVDRVKAHDIALALQGKQDLQALGKRADGNMIYAGICRIHFSWLVHSRRYLAAASSITFQIPLMYATQRSPAMICPRRK